MLMIRMLLTALLVVLLTSACSLTPVEKRGRVHCPACGVEMDALFEKRY